MRDALVVAVDLPSGVDADTGEVHGEAVRADVTVTFGAYKPGLLIDPGREYAGAVRLVGLGLELAERERALEALQYVDVAGLLPLPSGESDKYRRGVVGVVAGSARYPGAAVLCVAGALRGGAGAVRYVGPATDAVIARFPEALVSAGPPSKAGRVQAWVVGPGLGDDEERLRDVVGAEVPVLIDADGLRLVAERTVRERRARTLLTPHAGEAAALLGVAREEVEAARLSAVRELAGRFGATVLLKGSTTLVGTAEGTCASTPPARPGSPRPAAATCCPASRVPCLRRASVRGMRGRSARICMALPPGMPRMGRLWPRRMWPMRFPLLGGMFGGVAESRGHVRVCGRVLRYGAGMCWPPTVGGGDVLSGLGGSLLAAGLGAGDAGSVGAYLHGLAAWNAAGGAPVAAQDVADAIPAAWRDVRRGG